MSASAACALGLLYAAVSVYWGAGGSALVDTVGGSLARLGRERDTTVVLALWGAAILKLAAAALPVLALRRGGKLRLLSWAAGAILTAYGAVLTTVGLLVQAGIVRSSAHADHEALAWHAYLWDPWFLVWGLLIAYSLRRSSSARRADCSRPARSRSDHPRATSCSATNGIT